MKSSKLNSVFEAVFSGDLATLRLAISEGQAVNAVDGDGRTPLFQAAIDGRTDLITELIRNGGNVNAIDNAGKTPLHLAVIQKQFDSAETLLNHQAFVDAPDNDGNTPLSDAVFYSEGDGGMIKLLLRCGADADRQNKHGVSPKQLADSIGNYDVSKFFKV